MMIASLLAVMGFSACGNGTVSNNKSHGVDTEEIEDKYGAPYTEFEDEPIVEASEEEATKG